MTASSPHTSAAPWPYRFQAQAMPEIQATPLTFIPQHIPIATVIQPPPQQSSASGSGVSVGHSSQGQSSQAAIHGSGLQQGPGSTVIYQGVPAKASVESQAQSSAAAAPSQALAKGSAAKGSSKGKDGEGPSKKFMCGFPGCGKPYACRDGVRRHARQNHPAWLQQLDAAKEQPGAVSYTHLTLPTKA